MIEGKKKLIVILCTVAVHALAGFLAAKGLDLDPAQQATLIEVLAGSLSLIVGFYLHTQGKVDVAKNATADIEDIKKALRAELKTPTAPIPLTGELKGQGE